MVRNKGKLTIELIIDWESNEKNNLVFEIKDNGTGISESDLIRLTQKVGESRSADSDFANFKKDMPYWLQPTGAFGIGLQSIFLVTKSFTIQTKSEKEESKEVVFYSAKKGEYSRITDNKPSIERGTTIKVKVSKEKCIDLFSSYEPQTNREYDFFDNKYEHLFIHQIENYILKEFEYLNLLSVSIIGQRVKEANGGLTNKIAGISDSIRQIIDGLLISLSKEKNLFYVCENIGVGSDLYISFYEDFEQGTRYYPGNEQKYLVRDIPVKDNHMRRIAKGYFNFIWNLQSPKSDKILNISRDKLINKTEVQIRRALYHTILPKAIPTMLELFESKNESIANEKVAIEYFHLELTAILYGSKTKHLDRIYQEFELPATIGVKQDFTKVKLKDFFTHKRILLIQGGSGNEEYEFNIPELKKFWRKINNEQNFGDVLILDNHEFYYYLVASNYSITLFNIFNFKDVSISCKLLEPSVGKTSYVSYNELAIKSLFHFDYGYKTGTRKLIYPLLKFAEMLAVEGEIEGAIYAPNFVSSFIVSPFKYRKEYEDIYQETKSQRSVGNREAVMDIVRRSYTHVLVPEKMQDWIIMNRVGDKEKQVTREMILDTYSELITDLLFIEIPNDVLDMMSFRL